MHGQAKLILFGTLMIVHGIQNGVLSQWSPSPCYDDIKAVGDIFCTITGQNGFMDFLWPTFPKILVVLCKKVYLNLSIPFTVRADDIVKCPDYWKNKFDEWIQRWSENKEDARKALCDHTHRDW
uniref:Putative salivary secreted protein n=1 Tax=Ixodes ricinus TaxID=34613 RepID=A0A090XBW2_IXORI